MSSFSNPHHLGKPSPKLVKDELNIPAKDLNIVWGEDDRYWSVPKDENSPAQLHQVSWLEVMSSVTGTSPSKNYEVGLRVSLTPDAFGWSNSPIYIMAKRGKEGEFASKKVLLDTNKKGEFEITGKLMKAEKPVVQDHSDDANKVYFGLYEVWSGKWKGGLNIHHAFIRESP